MEEQVFVRGVVLNSVEISLLFCVSNERLDICYRDICTPNLAVVTDIIPENRFIRHISEHKG